MTCERCGAALSVGDWPFCPHGRGYPMFIDDTLEGGARWCETMGHEPVWLDGSKSQWRQLVAEKDLVNIDRHDSTYFARLRRRHDEELKDTGTSREY